MKERVYINDLQNYVEEDVKISGWVHRIRNLGKIAFIVLRDKTGTIQCVVDKDLIESIKDLQVESILNIEGKVVKTQGEDLEIQVRKIDIHVAITEPVPVEINKDEIDAHLETVLDHRPVTLRHEKQRAIFRTQAGILNCFRNSMIKQGFTEFRSPALMGAPSESGASVFEVKYYENKAYLAQSPQVFKQIMVGVFEKVFTTATVFRAEKHNTTRHLMEITQLDAEMGFIKSYEDALDVAETFVKDLVDYLAKNHQKDLDLWNVDLPRSPKEKFPRVKVKDALKIIEDRTGKSAQRKELDLDPEDEREIAKWVLEEYNSDFLWLLNFKKDKNFYTWNSDDSPDESLSFDLECRGLEWLSGTHRIHDYETLVKRMKNQDLSLENYAHYLEAFKYGIPSEAGMSFGLERMTQQIFKLKNIREACLFPSDLDRIAGQKINTLKT